MLKLSLLLVFAVLLVICSAAASHGQTADQISQDTEEYELYSLLINSLFILDNKHLIVPLD